MKQTIGNIVFTLVIAVGFYLTKRYFGYDALDKKPSIWDKK